MPEKLKNAASSTAPPKPDRSGAFGRVSRSPPVGGTQKKKKRDAGSGAVANIPPGGWPRQPRAGTGQWVKTQKKVKVRKGSARFAAKRIQPHLEEQ